MIIDFSAHLIPREDIGRMLETRPYYGLDASRYQLPYPAGNSDPRVRIGLMDKHGIDVQLLSQTAPVLLGFKAGAAFR